MIYLELLFTFFYIGLVTFGGGYAMLPLIQQTVIQNGWIEPEPFIDFIAVSESTPGPFAINMATYIGIERGGLPGAFFATLGVVLPSFIIILIVANIYEKFQKSTLIKGLMSGLKPAVIGLIASAVLEIGKTALFHGETLTVGKEFIVSLVIFIAMFTLIMKKVHPIVIIAISAVLGIIAGYFIL